MTGVELKPYPLVHGVSTLRVWVRNHHPNSNNEDPPVFTVNRRLYFNCRDRTYWEQGPILTRQALTPPAQHVMTTRSYPWQEGVRTNSGG